MERRGSSAPPWGEGRETKVVPIPSWIAPKWPTPKVDTEQTAVLEPTLPDLPELESYGEGVPAPVVVMMDAEEDLHEEPGSLHQEPGDPEPDYRSENIALRAHLAEMAMQMARFQRQILEASETQVVRLACTIAERIVKGELKTDPRLIVEWVRDGMDALASADELVVAISPDLSEMLPAEAWADVISVPYRLEVDAALGLSQCELRATVCSVDVSSEAQIAAVADHLGLQQR